MESRRKARLFSAAVSVVSVSVNELWFVEIPYITETLEDNVAQSRVVSSVHSTPFDIIMSPPGCFKYSAALIEIDKPLP